MEATNVAPFVVSKNRRGFIVVSAVVTEEGVQLGTVKDLTHRVLTLGDGLSEIEVEALKKECIARVTPDEDDLDECDEDPMDERYEALREERDGR